MHLFSLRAAIIATCVVMPVVALAQVPAYQPLNNVEVATPPGSSGTDYSANALTAGGLTLLATIPDATTKPRRGFIIEAMCTAGLVVVFDSSAGGTATFMKLAGGASNGEQGGSVDYGSMPHSGRIRVYSSNAVCPMAARVWE